MIETGAEVEGRRLRGSTVSVHYDPMLAKVITVAPTRIEAARLLASTLERARIHGLTTNRPGRRHRYVVLGQTRPGHAGQTVGR
ncbi:Probable acetyl-/propionyl-CoA carboxylase alpha subunit AccA2 [Mycobacteroides abscessus subsp. abscessus]|nr:Probable acetyl-/propionyl-CoA carboxylase alpha subunit AccA2 [Mycobacteroides abscessus subsp. abscessus]